MAEAPSLQAIDPADIKELSFRVISLLVATICVFFVRAHLVTCALQRIMLPICCPLLRQMCGDRTGALRRRLIDFAYKKRGGEREKKSTVSLLIAVNNGTMEEGVWGLGGRHDPRQIRSRARTRTRITARGRNPGKVTGAVTGRKFSFG